MNDRLPARFDRGDSPVRGDRPHLPVRPTAPSPVHAAQNLSFGGSASTREEVWDQFSPAIRERVNGRAGQLVEWWATDNTGRGSAAVLGTKAFVTVDPTINAAGKPAHEIRALRLEESSFRRAPVVESATNSTHTSFTISGRRAGGSVPGSRPGVPEPAPNSTLATRLGTGMSGFLGNLPARAQTLLQEPFINDREDLWYDWYYFRTGTEGSLSGSTLQIWCYLANKRFVTFAGGTGHGYREHSGPRAWNITCWRVEVSRNSR